MKNYLLPLFALLFVSCGNHSQRQSYDEVLNEIVQNSNSGTIGGDSIIDAFIKKYPTYDALLNDDRFMTVTVMKEDIMLALISDYIDAGQFDNAQRLYDDMLKYAESEYGEISQLVAMTYYEKAHLYERVGDLDNAVKMMQKSAMVFKKLPKSDMNLYEGANEFIKTQDSIKICQYFSLEQIPVLDSAGRAYLKKLMNCIKPDTIYHNAVDIDKELGALRAVLYTPYPMTEFYDWEALFEHRLKYHLSNPLTFWNDLPQLSFFTSEDYIFYTPDKKFKFYCMADPIGRGTADYHRTYLQYLDSLGNAKWMLFDEFGEDPDGAHDGGRIFDNKIWQYTSQDTTYYVLHFLDQGIEYQYCRTTLNIEQLEYECVYFDDIKNFINLTQYSLINVYFKYNQLVDGYEVTGRWMPMPLGADSNIGYLILNFRDTVNGKSFQYITQELTFTEGFKGYQNGDMHYFDYNQPKNGIGDNIPFQFFDVDFDKEKELLINVWGKSYNYKVYKVTTNGLRLLDYLPFNSIDNSTEFNANGKQIRLKNSYGSQSSVVVLSKHPTTIKNKNIPTRLANSWSISTSILQDYYKRDKTDFRLDSIYQYYNQDSVYIYAFVDGSLSLVEKRKEN